MLDKISSLPFAVSPQIPPLDHSCTHIVQTTRYFKGWTMFGNFYAVWIERRYKDASGVDKVEMVAFTYDKHGNPDVLVTQWAFWSAFHLENWRKKTSRKPARR